MRASETRQIQQDWNPNPSKKKKYRWLQEAPKFLNQMEESLGESNIDKKDEKIVWPFSSAKLQNPESSKKRKANRGILDWSRRWGKKSYWPQKFKSRGKIPGRNRSSFATKFTLLSTQYSPPEHNRSQMSEWGDAGKVFVKFSPNEEREREREKRKTRGYVSRCPNFIHSHPFVRSFVCFTSVSVHLSFVRSFVLFIRSVFVCLLRRRAIFVWWFLPFSWSSNSDQFWAVPCFYEVPPVPVLKAKLYLMWWVRTSVGRVLEKMWEPTRVSSKSSPWNSTCRFWVDWDLVLWRSTLTKKKIETLSGY